jgi:hypothetical protein
MARKIDEAANFVFVQLIEQESGIYEKQHPDYARQDKIDLAWEAVSYETKESGSRLSFSKQYKRISLNCYRRMDASSFCVS